MLLRQSMPVPPTAKNPAHPLSHRLDQQAASNLWDVFIDETGARFVRNGKGELGRVVAVAVSRDTVLPDLGKGWHSTHQANDVLNARLNDLLHAPTGVIGLSAGGVRDAHDGWATLVQRLMLLTAASLPTKSIADAGPRIHFWVEQHGQTKPGSEGLGMAALEDAVRQLGIHETACRVRVSVIEKDGHPRLAWADLVAHTWAGASRRSRSRLTNSRLLDSCLHEPTAASEELWRLSLGDSEDPATAWLDALAEQQRSDKDLREMLLRILERRVAKQPAMWRTLLDKLSEYADGKAVDSGLYSDACRFIERTRPAGAALPPHVELGVQIASVVRGNHLGETSEEPLRALQVLAASRRGSNPQLAGEADLVCAVRHTNAFRFEAARAAMAEWESGDLGVSLQWRGRWFSQLGQIHAFQGDLPAAREAFHQALHRFRQLGEPEKQRESTHTSTYLMLAAIEDASVRDDNVRILVDAGAGLLPGALRPETLQDLAVSDGPRTQYVHHAVVRYLACRGNALDAEPYLAVRKTWGVRLHHPWPLIDLWRAILIGKHRPDTLDVARPLLTRAINTCRDHQHSGVIQLIGETIAVVRRLMELGAGADEQRLRELCNSLPGVQQRVDFLLARPNVHPAELVTRVLPFNFK